MIGELTVGTFFFGRQLEAIIRISEALAKLTLSPVVQNHHVDEAIRLFKFSTMDAVSAGPVDGMTRGQLNEEMNKIEKEIRRRLPIGWSTSYQSLVKEFVNQQGYTSHALERTLFVMEKREVLRFSNQASVRIDPLNEHVLILLVSMGSIEEGGAQVRRLGVLLSVAETMLNVLPNLGSVFSGDGPRRLSGRLPLLWYACSEGNPTAYGRVCACVLLLFCVLNDEREGITPRGCSARRRAGDGIISRCGKTRQGERPRLMQGQNTPSGRGERCFRYKAPVRLALGDEAVRRVGLNSVWGLVGAGNHPTAELLQVIAMDRG